MGRAFFRLNASPSQSPGTSGAARARLLALVADDARFERLGALLVQAVPSDVELARVRSGDEAVRELARSRIHALVLTASGEGRRALDLLRRRPHLTARVPVLVLLAAGAGAAAESLLRVGVQECVAERGCDARRLTGALARATARHRSLVDLSLAHACAGLGAAAEEAEA